MSDDQQLTLFSEAPPPRLGRIARAFEPARLTQARVLAWKTKSELAERIGVSAAAIGQFEAGAVTPKPEHLPEMARVLHVPVSFFAAGRPLGRLDVADAHFRSLRSTRSKDRAKAAAHAEQVWELTHALEKRIQFPELNLPQVPEGTPPVHAAQAVRSLWQLPRGPLAHLAAVMESRGIVICLIPLTNEAVTRVKAYSTSSLGRPIVVVTPERFRSVYEYRFTCAHELGHLILHQDPLPGDRKQEREADQFAAELLTPGSEIRPLLPKTARMAALAELSSTWGVSVESLIYRMGELQLISDVSIRRAHQRLAAMAEFRRDEPLSAYPGEVPTLLQEALQLAAQTGFTRADLADELCWTPSHLAEVLGEVDSRPKLSLVR